MKKMKTVFLEDSELADILDGEMLLMRKLKREMLEKNPEAKTKFKAVSALYSKLFGIFSRQVYLGIKE